jgi:membrane-associated phospholipid phosphatase
VAVFGAGAPAVCVRDRLDDPEPEPVTGDRSCLVRAAEALESVRQEAGRKPLAIVGDTERLSAVEKWAVPVVAVATFALWLLARPGGSRKWKLASACALGSAALALLINQAIGKTWHRKRPFTAHPAAHVWGSRSHDPSFPSDHASAAFAIAFAVFLFNRRVGSVFLAAAAVIGAGRVFIGEHYPLDVLAGCLVGLASALLLVRSQNHSSTGSSASSSAPPIRCSRPSGASAFRTEPVSSRFADAIRAQR